MVWTVSIHESAKRNFHVFQQIDPDGMESIIDHINRMAAMRQPQRYRNVKLLEYEATDWYRLADYDHNIRVIFRLDARNRIIELLRISYRPDAYGHKLTELYERIHTWSMT